jgi:hypothetical protein
MIASRIFGIALLTVSLGFGQDVRQAGVPPGIVQAGQAEAQAEKDIPPPIHSQPALDLAHLTQQADELAKLAQAVPLDIASIKKGMLPKDTLQKLKQIEKLSKRLRSELNP